MCNSRSIFVYGNNFNSNLHYVLHSDSRKKYGSKMSNAEETKMLKTAKTQNKKKNLLKMVDCILFAAIHAS